MNPKKQREKLFEILFGIRLSLIPLSLSPFAIVPNPIESILNVLVESHKAIGAAFSVSGAHPVYWAGKEVALALEIGEGVTSCFPVISGSTPMHAVMRYNFGGNDATKYLARIMTERGYYHHSSLSDIASVKTIKVCPFLG